MSIYVVFFGGYKASKTDMELWLTSARKQRDDVVFDAFPYPEGAGYKDTNAVDGFRKQFDGVIKKIEQSGADTIYIVGHSSGSAIANELNSRLEGDHSHITLVTLDGFRPTAGQIKKSNTQVWSAVGAGGKGTSLNWSSSATPYTATSATNKWSLHFSLVNTAVTDAIKSHDDITDGYAGCMSNLRWLEKKK